MTNERDPIFQDGRPGLTRVHPHLTIFAKSDGQRIIVEHAESLSGLLGEELLTAIKRWQDANPVRDLTVQRDHERRSAGVVAPGDGGAEK